MEELLNKKEQPAQKKEYINLNNLEQCALETAFSRRPDFFERIRNEQIAIKNSDKTKLTEVIYGNINEGVLKITPELRLRI